MSNVTFAAVADAEHKCPLSTHCGHCDYSASSHPMSSETKTVEAATSADGLRRWELVHRSDGFFLYSEDSFISEDLTEFGGGIMEYWTPTHFSGLFQTAEEARADAVGQLPWLKQLQSAA
ncbi:MAG: hypothetical protein ABI454_06455 [Sphingomicrobium sp.]